MGRDLVVVVQGQRHRLGKSPSWTGAIRGLQIGERLPRLLQRWSSRPQWSHVKKKTTEKGVFEDEALAASQYARAEQRAKSVL